jgi:hypothetical protein
MKRQGGGATMTPPDLLTTSNEREYELEKQIQELKGQLRRQEIQNILDLRVASGLISEKERVESAETLARIPADALTIMRRDLVKVLAKLSSIGSSPSPPTQSSRGDEPYIA